MKVVSRHIIDTGIKCHADAKEQLLSWLAETEKAEWKGPHDIKKRYSSASFLADNTVIFNIKGNNYRLVVKVAYNTKIVNIKWFGTHTEYNKMKFP